MADAPAPQDPNAGAAPQGGGSASDLVNGIHAGLTQLMQMMQQSKGIPPEAMQMAQQCLQTFEQLAQALGGQAAESGGDESPQGPSTPEAAGNQNAKPY